MKSAWIQAQGRSYPLWDMCYVLSVRISGYRAWCRGGKADRVQQSSAQALALIRSVHAESLRASKPK